MKKKTLLFTLVAGMAYVVFSSNLAGPGAGSAGDRTGAKGSTANCSSGGCHSGGTGAPTLNIRVDTAGGVEVTKYTAGKTYTVTVTGGHALNKFGFQYAAVSGSGGTQTNAGTFAGIPSGTAQHTAPDGIKVIEHTGVISGALSKSFTWTAPATGVGNVTMYLSVNAVNGTGNIDGDISANVNKVLQQYVPSTAVATVTNNIEVKAYPNPATDVLNLQVSNTYSDYTVQVYDIAGRNVLSTTINGVAGAATISTANWVPGMYNVVVANETGRKALQVVKQ